MPLPFEEAAFFAEDFRPLRGLRISVHPRFSSRTGISQQQKQTPLHIQDFDLVFFLGVNQPPILGNRNEGTSRVMAILHGKLRLNAALIFLLLSLVFLGAGISVPIITVRGIILPDGIANLAADFLAISQEERATFKEHVIAALNDSKEGPKTVYEQKRSIAGSIYTLFSNGGWFAASLIFLFIRVYSR